MAYANMPAMITVQPMLQSLEISIYRGALKKHWGQQ
jgi:hypothetical protein